MVTALVVGGAHCVWDDLEKAREFGPFDATACINDMLAHYEGPVDYAVSLHPEHFGRWLGEREAKGFPPPAKVVAHKGNTQEERRHVYPLDIVTDFRWPGMTDSGSSGLFAVKVLLEEGFDRIVLCGVPMDPQQSHFHDKDNWHHADTFFPAWERMFDHYGEQTRSVSGRTKDLLGYPTQEWISETELKEKPDGR